MNVPLLDVPAQNAPLRAELLQVFESVLDSGYFILGPEVEAFEKEAAEYLGVPHAIGVSSGTDALIVALLAAGVGPGDEVICPSFTFFATAGSVVRVGATPIFADSLENSFNIDMESAKSRITSKTKAIIPVHLFILLVSNMLIYVIVSGCKAPVNIANPFIDFWLNITFFVCKQH